MTKKYIQEYKNKLSNGGTLAPEELQDFFSRLEGDLKDKKYGLVWESQTEQVIEQLKTNKVYLEEEQDLKITQDPDNPKSNVLIEGDNYEALTYLNEINQKVDVIYIDPPYNTGNKDFIYNDRFIDKEDGFRHSSWLSFMNKRLLLARELLSDDGVIFISIDDNEIAQLKLLCDQIFGENNFISKMPRVTKKSGKSTSHVAKNNDEVLVYSKNRVLCPYFELLHFDDGYKKKDIYFETRGPYKQNQTLDYDTLGYVTSLDYPIYIQDKTYFPGNVSEEEFLNRKHVNPKDGYRWRWSPEKLKFGLENGFVVVSKSGRIYTKTYLNATIDKANDGYFVKYVSKTKSPTSLDLIDNTFSNDNATKELNNILGKGKFNYAKPSSLIKYLISFHPNKNAKVLDFFAGSGTTGHAVLELNKEDGGNRQFILCTNNENNIAEEVTYERLKRVMNGYTTPKGKDVPGVPSNLAYYKTKQVSKYDIDFDEVVLQHIIPTIQLTAGVYHRIRHSGHILQLGENIFIFNQYMVEDDEIDTLVYLVKDEDILYIQEGQVDYIKTKLPEGVVYKYLEDVLPTNR